MKKKTLAILLLVLLLIGAYVYRNYVAPKPAENAALQVAGWNTPTDAAAEETASAGLALVEETDGTDAAEEVLPLASDAAQTGAAETIGEPDEPAIAEDGAYTSRDDVALYIHTYGRLPDNFMTKKEAQALGWEGGGLDDYAYGMCIGGSYYGNYEGLLPERDGRKYTECDIDTLHRSSRGAKRIVFSNDGLIYYTGDHYESFTLLYGEE